MTEVAHSRFGGSVIGRIIACPGSVALCDTVPQTPSSRYAEEGTAAHALAALCLQKDQHPTEFLGVEMGVGFPVTQEMCDAVVVYLNAVTHELAKTKTAELYVEVEFDLSSNLENAEEGEVFGRCDCVVYHPETGRVRGFDYKHGVGVSVVAEENAQNKFYLTGAIMEHKWRVSEIVATIAQPRARDADEVGAIKDWTFQTPDLFEFLGDVDTAIGLAKGPNPPLQAGLHCDKSFCDARIVCPAYQAFKLEGTGFESVDVKALNAVDLPPPDTLTSERLAAIVAGVSRLSTWMNTCQEYLEARLLGGEAVPGWKVVEKIGRAKWIADEERIAATLETMFDIDKDLVLPRKLTTIGDIEKLMKAAGATKRQIDDFKLKNTLKESSGLTIAQDSDRRPAVNAAERAFGDVSI